MVRLGRPITQRDVDEAAPVVVVSASRCDAAKAGGACLGETLTLNGDGPYEIVGVTPDAFVGTWFPGRGDAWVPISRTTFISGSDPNLLRSKGTSFLTEVVGRLRPGATIGDAQAQLDAVSAAVASWSPAEARKARTARLTPSPGLGLRPAVRQRATAILRQLGGVAVALLLLTCLNVGALWRARAMEQQRELAVRHAGASGRRSSGTARRIPVLASAGCAGLWECVRCWQADGHDSAPPILAPLVR